MLFNSCLSPRSITLLYKFEWGVSARLFFNCICAHPRQHRAGPLATPLAAHSPCSPVRSSSLRRCLTHSLRQRRLFLRASRFGWGRAWQGASISDVAWYSSFVNCSLAHNQHCSTATAGASIASMKTQHVMYSSPRLCRPRQPLLIETAVEQCWGQRASERASDSLLLLRGGRRNPFSSEICTFGHELPLPYPSDPLLARSLFENGRGRQLDFGMSLKCLLYPSTGWPEQDLTPETDILLL